MNTKENRKVFDFLKSSKLDGIMINYFYEYIQSRNDTGWDEIVGLINRIPYTYCKPKDTPVYMCNSKDTIEHISTNKITKFKESKILEYLNYVIEIFLITYHSNKITQPLT